MLDQAKLSDLDRIVEMENEAFQCDRITKKRFREYIINNGRSSELIVWRDYERTNGFILLLVPANRYEARIHSYAVDPSVRGKGVGAALIEEACKLAKHHNKDVIRTEVRVDSPHAQQRYEKSGFQKMGHRLKYYADGMDSVSYARPI